MSYMFDKALVLSIIYYESDSKDEKVFEEEESIEEFFPTLHETS